MPAGETVPAATPAINAFGFELLQRIGKPNENALISRIQFRAQWRWRTPEQTAQRARKWQKCFTIRPTKLPCIGLSPIYQAALLAGIRNGASPMLSR